MIVLFYKAYVSSHKAYVYFSTWCFLWETYTFIHLVNLHYPATEPHTLSIFSNCIIFYVKSIVVTKFILIGWRFICYYLYYILIFSNMCGPSLTISSILTQWHWSLVIRIYPIWCPSPFHILHYLAITPTPNPLLTSRALVAMPSNDTTPSRASFVPANSRYQFTPIELIYINFPQWHI